MRNLFQTTKAAPPEAPAPPPSTVRMAHDGERVIRTVPYGEVPEYRARGFREVPNGAVPDDGTPYRDADTDPDPETRDLWPVAIVQRPGNGQLQQWVTKLGLSRDALDDAATTLAKRINRPPLPRDLSKQGDLPASAAYACDVGQAAITAEAVVRLAAEVDRLSVEVAALRNAAKNG